MILHSVTKLDNESSDSHLYEWKIYHLAPENPRSGSAAPKEVVDDDGELKQLITETPRTAEVQQLLVSIFNRDVKIRPYIAHKIIMV